MICATIAPRLARLAARLPVVMQRSSDNRCS
jgi:hypothetical protein